MPEFQIYKATYSGIPVYEMMAKGIAVMRRRSDSWLNATQILKVAGFDKPQRTRVLEREVQKGDHEKVQGGYGKYQGTWIPPDRGLELCRQYGCETLLRPLIEFQPAENSPPPAPKHAPPATAASRRGAPSESTRGGSVNTRSTRRNAHEEEDVSHIESGSEAGSEDGSLSPSPSGGSTSSRTPSPIANSGYASDPSDGEGRPASPPPTGKRRLKQQRGGKRYRQEEESEGEKEPDNQQVYADTILEYFVSDTSKIPDLFINPPPDFDPNMSIDDDGHTPLHWACAMGRIRIVKLLLSAGADIFKTNTSGQTPLMRSVMFSNNYDVRKFQELYELLHKSTLNIDNHNRTVFHHIVDVAMSKGKTHAARYYMETLIERLANYPSELADIINFQDEEGETALTMAAKCRSKRLVKLLIDHGANPKIANRDSKTTEDYILEDERFRASPTLGTRTLGMSYRNSQASGQAANGSGFSWRRDYSLPLHHSLAAQTASTRCVNDMAAMFESLGASFDVELKEKERDLNQAKALLKNIEGEILESQRAVGHLKVQAQGLDDAKETLGVLHQQIRTRMDFSFRSSWGRWVKDEQARERAVRELHGGALPSSNAHSDAAANGFEVNGHVDSSVQQQQQKGKRKADDTDELIELYSNIPADPAALAEACNALRSELVQHRKRRRHAFDEFIDAQAETGTSGKLSQYRKLISAGCGGIPPGEVDVYVPQLLETLEAEEPSSIVWTGSNAPSKSTVPVA